MIRTLEIPSDLDAQIERAARERDMDAGAFILEATRAALGADTPQRRAAQILADFRCGDIRKRNAAILRMARGDAQTRALVESEVEKSVAAYDGPDDDFADWHALDGEPFHFPEEPEDFLTGLYREEKEDA